jgi:hypothetical protein
LSPYRQPNDFDICAASSEFVDQNCITDNKGTVPITVSSNELPACLQDLRHEKPDLQQIAFFVFAAILQFEKRISVRPLHHSLAAILITI